MLITFKGKLQVALNHIEIAKFLCICYPLQENIDLSTHVNYQDKRWTRSF